MAARRTTRSLKDSLVRARPKDAKPARVSLIQNGMKYKSGQAPVRVCPARPHVAATLAKKI